MSDLREESLAWHDAWCLVKHQVDVYEFIYLIYSCVPFEVTM